VKNFKHIYESLDAFILGEMLEGDNAYYCDKCEKKIPTLKRVCIKSLPNYLIVVLKRFEFNFDTMQKIKVNDYFEFPETLNLQRYTLDFLLEQEQSLLDGKAQESQMEVADKKPHSYYDYDLRGIVIHKGNADAGHYYSLIKDHKDAGVSNGDQARWLEFNDTDVKEFDISNLKNEAYGDSATNNLDPTGNRNKRGTNAYILIYERKQLFNEKSEKIDD
jgi:ubiquitin carboxyl-terminal hydrolase 9/24